MNKLLTSLFIALLASASFGQSLDLETNIGDPQYVHWYPSASLPDATPAMDATLSALVVQPATNGNLYGGDLLPFAEGYNDDEPWAAFYVPGTTRTAPFHLSGRNKVAISTLLVRYVTSGAAVSTGNQGTFQWDSDAQSASAAAGPWNLYISGSAVNATGFAPIHGATEPWDDLTTRVIDVDGCDAIVLDVSYAAGPASAGNATGVFWYDAVPYISYPQDTLSNIILESTPVIIIRAVD